MILKKKGYCVSVVRELKCLYFHRLKSLITKILELKQQIEAVRFYHIKGIISF